MAESITVGEAEGKETNITSSEGPVREASSIQAIDRRSVHRICSGQVVLTLGVAIKELVENSVDAGASSVDIRLKEFGSELIEVSDNGSGVEEKNFKGLTLKHHTSKLQDFSDLVNVETFGFRGEALSSLCALSNLSVITCHVDATVGTKLEYDHHGNLTRQTPCARQTGTTVYLENLFHTLPVRHKEFQRNLKREFSKMVQVVNAYCLINTRVKIHCTNQSGKSPRSLFVSTVGNSTTRENIVNIFGPKQIQQVLEFKQFSPSEEICVEYGVKPVIDGNHLFQLSGFISKCEHGQGRSSTDRQFIFINKRPCDSTKIIKVINEVYHQYNRHQYPFVVLDIRTEKTSVDVNVTPDKRQIFLQQEKLLLAVIKTSLIRLFEPTTCKMTVNIQPGISRQHSDSTDTDKNSSKCGGSLVSKLKRSFSAAFNRSQTEPSPNKLENSPKRQKYLDRFVNRRLSKPEDKPSIPELRHFLSPSSKGGNSLHTQLSPFSRGVKVSVENDSVINVDDEDKESGISSSLPSSSSSLSSSKQTSTSSSQECLDDSVLQGQKSRTDQSHLVNREQSVIELEHENNNVLTKTKHSQNSDYCQRSFQEHNTENESRECDVPTNDSGSTLRSVYVLKHHVTEIEDEEESMKQDTCKDGESPRQEVVVESKSRGDGVQAEPETCVVLDEKTERRKQEKTIEFSLDKLKRCHRGKGERSREGFCRSFRATISPGDNQTAEEELQREIRKEMFSQMEILGQFNLGFIITKHGDDLFIVDQHATDEKYNFEMLQKNTTLQSQKLIQPLCLELTASNETILADNLDIFTKNGFEFIIDEQAPPTQRVKLVSTPVSRNWNFGKEDIEELVFMLTDSPGIMCRPSRVRMMFASRSCRKAVMIGTALNKAEMKKLVCHMGEIEMPWNCPHGRPTMRHLFNLQMLPRS